MTRKEELAIKLERIRSLMLTLGLDGVYLKRQDDFAWLTCGGQNYLGWGEMGMVGLLVTQAEAYAITNDIEKRRMLDEEQLEELGFAMHSSVWHDTGFETRTLNTLVPTGKLGLDFTSPMGANIDNEVKKLRLSLTAGEAERIKQVGYMASLAMEEAAMSLRPGLTEIEAVKRVAMALYDQGMEFTSLMCAADERLYNYRHAIPTMNKMKERVQIGGNMRKWGLTVCLTRYINFVPVTDELRKQYRINQEIDCTLMQKTVVGRPYNEPLLAAKALYEKYGYASEFDKHHLGGPIGYANRDYRVDPALQLPVMENQAFCWNPSITGTKSEDTILVHKGGFDFVTRGVLFPENTVTVGGKTYTRCDILEKY